jgi:hypothetical protein
MAMTNADCISYLEWMLMERKNIESYILENDDMDKDDLREIEKEIESLRRAIRALERTARKKK